MGKNLLLSLALVFLTISSSSFGECRKSFIRSFSLMDNNGDGVISQSERKLVIGEQDYLIKYPNTVDGYPYWKKKYLRMYDFNRNGSFDSDDATIRTVVLNGTTGCDVHSMAVFSRAELFSTDGIKYGKVHPIDILNFNMAQSQYHNSIE